MRFEVDGKVKGKGRPRFAGGHAFTPQETKAYEQLIAASYRKWGGKLLTRSDEDPVQIMVIMVYEPNKGDSKMTREKKLANEILPTKKPDEDNCLKVVCDALQGGVAFHDDKQVVISNVYKCYGPQAKLIVEVDAMKGGKSYDEFVQRKLL